MKAFLFTAPLRFTVLPSFIKTPRDSTIRTGHTARLECAAEGHPAPQIAWQKDGGTDFPAARERRMHVMPDDDVFFIMDVKPEDMGLYSCTAKNTAGTVSANATLTVLGEKTGSAAERETFLFSFSLQLWPCCGSRAKGHTWGSNGGW